MLMFHLKKPGKKNLKLTLYHYHLKVGGGEGREGREEKGRGKELLSRWMGEGGMSGLLSHPSSYLNPSHLSKPPSPPTMNLSPCSHYESPPLHPLWIYHYFFPAAISYGKSVWNERQLQCCVLIPFLHLLTSFDFKFEWLSRTNKCLLTSSIISGSNAVASHLLFRMKMFGLERRWFTFRKNFFSCKWQGSNEKLHKHGKVTSMNATTLDKFVL